MSSSRVLRALICTVCLAVGIALTGCAASVTSHDETSHLPVNNADVSFAQQMILRHRQAIAMASMAQSRSKSPLVNRLTDGISRARRASVTELIELLTLWRRGAPSPGPTQPQGTITANELNRLLESASGAQFDQVLVGLMIEHHRESLASIVIQQESGQSPRARSIAIRLERELTAEITAMQKFMSLSPRPPR